MTAIGPRELSPRQREILALVAAGRTSKEIAGQLGISESTVNWHLANAFDRLGASSRAEAVALAMRDDVPHSGGDGADAQSAQPSGEVPRPTLPLSSIALAFALTLLVGLVGGALIAEWNVISPTPTPSGTPTAPASPSASPTTQPTRGSAPRSPSGMAPQQSNSAPATHSAGAPGTGTIAPLLPPALPSATVPPAPLNALPSLPAVPSITPVPSVPLPLRSVP